MIKTILNPFYWKFWIIISILVSIGHLFISINYNGLSFEKPFIKTGDSFDYITSSNSYLINKEFTFFKTTDWIDKSNLVKNEDYDKPLFYAYRSPGYAFILTPLLKFCWYSNALKYTVFLQVILYGIAIYLLCLISYKLFKNKKIFYITFLLLSISLGSSFWNVYIYTESFAFSFLIFSIFCLLIGFDSNKLVWYFFSGFFLSESIFLRPFLAPLLIIHLVLIIWKNGFKKSFLSMLLYLMPFIIIDGFWTIRNFSKTNEFIPLASTTKYHFYRNKAFLEQLNLYHYLGKPFSCNGWFFENKNLNKIENVYPKKFLSSNEVKVKMLLAKEYYLKSISRSLSKHIRGNYEYKSYKIQNSLLKKYKEKYELNSFHTRFYSAKILLNQGTINGFKNFPKFNKALNYFQKIWNNFVFYFGFFSLFVGIYRFKNDLFKLSIIFLPIFLFLFFSLSNIAETREMFIPSFFMLLFAVEFSSFLILKKMWLMIIGMFTFVLLF